MIHLTLRMDSLVLESCNVSILQQDPSEHRDLFRPSACEAHILTTKTSSETSIQFV